MTADSTLELAFPGLVIRLDQVDAVPLPLGEREHLMHDAGLAHRRRQGAFSHPAGARPPKFADEDVLVGKRGHDLLADGVDVLRSIARGYREVLPIRQDMDR